VEGVDVGVEAGFVVGAVMALAPARMSSTGQRPTDDEMIISSALIMVIVSEIVFDPSVWLYTAAVAF